MAKPPQPRLEINLEEIYQILDSARQQPMSETDCEKVKTAVAALAEKAAPGGAPQKEPMPCSPIRTRTSRDMGATPALRSPAPTGSAWRTPRSRLATRARNA